MLDKKALRKFAGDNPAPAIPPNHGLLRARQVGYIIRTDIRIIGHRRTLVLYVYDRGQAAAGDSMPVWTMFQAGEDYTTLARKDDGPASWRSASFERLGKDYHFAGSCAFYSARDGQRVRDFFHDRDRDGIAALVRAQQAVLDRRTQERRRRRERRTLDRMKPLRALPRGLDAWIRREIMPAYFRCGHASARKPVTGICTSCRKESVLPRASHNDKITCPRCKRELTVKSAGKAGRYSDLDTVQAIEKTGGSGVVIRIVKVRYDYSRDRLMPDTDIYESARIFMRAGTDGKAVAEPYWFAPDKGELTHWRPGQRPMFPYCSNFEAGTYGHVYCRSLPDALDGTPWEYCPVETFYRHFREPMQLAPFLSAYLEHPKLEHLVKTGFFDLASDLAYGRVRAGMLDEARNRTHRILRVSAGDVPFLREQEADAAALSAFLECPDCRDRQKLFLWRRECGVTHDVKQVLAYASPYKLMKYAERQFERLSARKDQYGAPRYRGMQSVVSEYRDYLEMCAGLGCDMKDKSVVYPMDLQAAHDRTQARVKARADARMRREFDAAMKAVSGHLDFEHDGMRIVLPSRPEDLEAEGSALHHCVATYAGRVAEHECVIAFLRRCEDPDKPFYTIEIRNGKIVQVRGTGNCDATPEVDEFVAAWEKQVFRAA